MDKYELIQTKINQIRLEIENLEDERRDFHNQREEKYYQLQKDRNQLQQLFEDRYHNFSRVLQMSEQDTSELQMRLQYQIGQWLNEVEESYQRNYYQMEREQEEKDEIYRQRIYQLENTLEENYRDLRQLDNR